MIDFRDMDLTDTVFTHRDPKTKEVRIFNITRLEKLVRMASAYGLEIVGIAVREEDKPIFVNRGLEPHRLVRITFPFPPILVCEMEDNTSLIVDGNHRFFKCYELGLTACPAYRIPKAIWEKALVDLKTFPVIALDQDQMIDDVFLSGFSGIA